MRAVFMEMTRLAFAADLEVFARFQLGRDEMGEWADTLRYSRGTIHIRAAQFDAFFRDYIALLTRYTQPDDLNEQDPAPHGGPTRAILTRFLAFPAPDDAPNTASLT
jgi:hypothetical protein